jgi:predicted nucleic acid-binding protein
MLVVADSSPLVVLINVGHIEVLPALFANVIIPPQVSTELRQSGRPQSVRQFMDSLPGWLLERTPIAIEPIPSLHSGELAAISLAKEMKADLLLIDEMRGRKAAVERQIPITGTIGVLELAADRRLLDLGDAFAAIKRTDFWISHKLLDERLSLYLARRRPQPGS